MKLAKGAIAAAVDRPDPAVRFYLFHGADEAGSRALGQRLLKGLEAERYALTGSAMKGDPALLGAEAGAISMFGGKRLLWIEPAGDEIAAAVEALLQLPAVEHAAVAIAGTLRKTSALLKLAETAPAAVAQISYLPEGRDADRLVMELGRTEGLRVAPQVATRIATASANDQAVIVQELRKFALYLGASSESPRDLTEDVVDQLGADASESDAGRLGDLALSGDLPALSAELERLEASGVEPIPVVRALQRRLLALAPMRARLDSGQAADAVMASVFWKDKPLVSKMLSRWNGERLAQAMARVAKLERQLLLTKAPDRAAMSEELLQIARAAGRSG